MEELLDKLSKQTDDLSTDELLQLHALFKSEEGRHSVEQWMLVKWGATDHTAQPALETLIDKVEHRLHRKYTTKSTQRWLPTFRKYAALLFIPLLAGFSFLLVKMLTPEPPVEFAMLGTAEQEYISPVGMRSRVVLHDSTVVWLNADSRLIVAAGFNEKTRNVRLIGEAYFEVTRKADNMPFVVSTPEMDIKVLGTTFNISAYPESKTMETVLVEGKIEAVIKNTRLAPQKEIQVEPAQLLTVHKNANDTKVYDNVNTDLYTSWKNGKLIFRSTPIDEVARTLERWYNVTITLHDEELKNYTYSGTFDNRSIAQIMQYIELSSPIYYKIDKERISIYAKQQEK